MIVVERPGVPRDAAGKPMFFCSKCRGYKPRRHFAGRSRGRYFRACDRCRANHKALAAMRPTTLDRTDAAALARRRAILDPAALDRADAEDAAAEDRSQGGARRAELERRIAAARRAKAAACGAHLSDEEIDRACGP